MRLLLRAEAHRLVRGGVEVAASPDTPDREAWKWQLRVLDGEAGSGVEAGGDDLPESERLALSLPRSQVRTSVLEVRSDPRAIVVDGEVVIGGQATTLERGLHEVTVVVVGQGSVRIEGRHQLGELDAMVLEGDDPLTVSLERDGDAPASVAIVRFTSAGAQPISWVP